MSRPQASETPYAHLSPVPGRRTQLSPRQFRTLTRNIVNTYEGASDRERVDGQLWYPQAYDTADELATRHGKDVRTGAGVIAALSPQNGWEKNVADARELFHRGPAARVQTMPQRQKALDILDGHDPLDVLHGQKERAFFSNIVDPEDPAPVTIDRHAHDIAIGKRLGEGERGLRSAGRYGIFSDAYRTAAKMVGADTANEVQATTWVRWRNEAPPTPGRRAGASWTSWGDD